MTILYLVRHGETEWNRMGRVQGHQDPPLNETGQAQARALAARLSQVEFHAAYSSDLQRAFETARILLGDRSMTIATHRDLRERFLGRWEGQIADDLPVVDPEAWRAWLRRRPDEAPHGGETETQLEQRALNAVSTIVTRHPDRTVLVVSHGGTIRATLRGLLGVDQHHTPNCGAYVIALEGTSRQLREIVEAL